jgi:hypothetical protein
MDTVNPSINRKTLFHVRPAFILACAALLGAIILPDALNGRHAAQRSVLLLASLAVALGWYFLLRYREPTRTWRALIALVTSAYLTASLPVFLFELSQIRWLMRHPWPSMYVMPWVRWGYLLVLWGVVGSLVGRGRARIAFVVAGVLLMILRASMGTWVF